MQNAYENKHTFKKRKHSAIKSHRIHNSNFQKNNLLRSEYTYNAEDSNRHTIDTNSHRKLGLSARGAGTNGNATPVKVTPM